MQTNRKSAAPAARQALRSFRVVFSSVKRHYKVLEARSGVGGSELWALTEIAKAPGLRVADLASRLLVHQSTASNLVEALVRGQLVAKQRSEQDERVVHLTATPRGRKVVERAPTPSEGLLPHAIARLSTAELASLNEGLNALLRAMAQHDPRAAATPLADL